MRKKQLLAENSSLFAEVERKNTELEAIKLRLEEEKGLVAALKEENANLKLAVSQLEEKISSAGEEIEELKNKLSADAERVLKPICTEEVEQVEAENTEPVEKVSQPTPMDSDIQSVISDIDGYNVVKSEPKPKAPKITEEQRNKLRRLGAAAIGRVTKATAYVTAELQSGEEENADRLYSLALGKNEGFKIQVLELVESDGIFEGLCDRLQKMTDMAAHTISSLLEK